MRTKDDVVNRLRAEFTEMPGMRLTSEQVQRLCGVERTVCQVVLDELVHAEFLCVKSDGRYGCATGIEKVPRYPAKADIRLSARVASAS